MLCAQAQLLFAETTFFHRRSPCTNCSDQCLPQILTFSLITFGSEAAQSVLLFSSSLLSYSCGADSDSQKMSPPARSPCAMPAAPLVEIACCYSIRRLPGLLRRSNTAMISTIRAEG